MDYPEMISSTLPVEAMNEMEVFRKPDKEWIKQESLISSYENFKLVNSQNRYTIRHEDVPFECLFLPGNKKKLYVMLSGGGTTTYRKYPSFLRWKYKNILDGSVLCIDDPMYYYHPEFTPVMWYYGTKEVSYLRLLMDIVRKFMEDMSLSGENVTFVGSSGGGYSALYCSNLLDYSSAIAMNPQFVLKDWQTPLVYDKFKSFGIDLADEDTLGRNNLYLTNKTCHFMIILNAKSLKEYDLQFTPFFYRQGITPKYGLAQNDNIITWIHGTEYSQVHSAIPYKNGVAFANFLLNMAIEGYDVEKYHGLCLLANEVLFDKFELQDKQEKAEKEKKCFFKFLAANVTSAVKEAIYRRIPRIISADFRKLLEYNYDVDDVISWSNMQVGYSIGEQNRYRYNLVYHNDKVFLRMLINDAENFFDDFEVVKIYLNDVSKTQISKWRITNDNMLVVAVALEPESLNEQISEFIGLTVEMLNNNLRLRNE